MRTFSYPVALGEESEKRVGLPKDVSVEVTVFGSIPDQKDFNVASAWEKAIADTKYNQMKNGKASLAAPPQFGDVMFEGLKVLFRKRGMSIISENIRAATGSNGKKGKKAKWSIE